MRAEESKDSSSERRPLTVLISPEVWKDLDDAALGKPPYPRVRFEKSGVVEEALRNYLPTLRQKF
ncbi:hypothetical protein ES703_04160 [subsurface metagenome]